MAKYTYKKYINSKRVIIGAALSLLYLSKKGKKNNG